MEKIFYEKTRDQSDKFQLEKSPLNINNFAHFHRNAEIHYITAGVYEVKINGKTHRYEKDEICFIPTCAIHSADPCESFSFMLFVSDDLCSDLEAVFASNTLPTELKNKDFNREHVLPLFDFMYNLGTEKRNRIVEKGFIDCVIGALIAEYGTVPNVPDKNYETAIKIINYIEKHSAEPLTLESAAAAFGYNKYYFSKIFNRVVNKNLNEYVNYVRLTKFVNKYPEARGGNLTDLVFECGFDSLPTFYRSFKKLYGTSPKKYFEGDK